MTTLQERGEKIGEDKYTEHWSLDGHTYVQVPKWVIEQVRAETIKEAVRVIEGEKHPNLSAMEKGSEFMTPRMYRALGHNDALSTAITAVEGLGKTDKQTEV